MTKSFFVVVPYTVKNFSGDTGIFKNLFSKQNREQKRLAEQADFEEKRSQLDQRVSVIKQGLASCGIKSAQLGSEEVVEVFYKVFNPGEVEGKIEIGKK